MIREASNLMREAFTAIVELVAAATGAIGLQGALILLTLAVSLLSYLSQKRASIREAIEQLDPRHVQYRVIMGSGGRRKRTRDVQLRAGINEIEYTRRQAKIGFFANRIMDTDSRVVSHSVPPFYLTIPDRNRTSQPESPYHPLGERIRSHDLIVDVDRTDEQLIVTCATTDPVECRNVANFVLDQHDQSTHNQIHQSDFSPML